MMICIDPGHGSKDPGAIGPGGLMEKDVVLLVAHEVKEHLSTNYETIMTRYEDNYVPLARRCGRANTYKADLFISIHCNSAENIRATGIETFHFPGSKNGHRLAGCIQEKIVAATGLRDRGVKSENFYVLRCTAMPAVLVELGFINNPDEEKLLGSTIYQRVCAKAIAQGVMRYIKGVKP